MEIMNCRNCHKLFNYISGPMICPECKKKKEEKFREVKEFIRKNPSKSISEVSKEMDVSVVQIEAWIRQERLCFSKESGVTLGCEMCGAPIYTGRYCAQCKHKMVNHLGGMYEEKENKKAPIGHTKEKMRHLYGGER